MTKKIESQDNYLVGVISDTHGHPPAGVQKAFEKVDLIIHAGDIGDEKILTESELDTIEEMTAEIYSRVLKEVINFQSI